MTITIRTKHNKWKAKVWFIESFLNIVKIDDEFFLGRAVQIAVAGHVFTISANWKPYTFDNKPNQK